MFSLFLFVVVAVQFFVSGQHLSLWWFVPTQIADAIIFFVLHGTKRESK